MVYFKVQHHHPLMIAGLLVLAIAVRTMAANTHLFILAWISVVALEPKSWRLQRDASYLPAH
jgi:hypothetical protein